MFFKKIVNFYRKPSSEKLKTIITKLRSFDALPFFFGISSFSTTQLVYKPDSFNYFNRHKEFIQLKRLFISHNKKNNSGDLIRLWLFILNIKHLLENGIEGDFAELGVWRGNTAAILAYYASLSNRKTFLFDTFEGFDERDISGIDSDKQILFANTSIDLVNQIIGDPRDCCIFVKGYFPSTVTDDIRNRSFAIVSIDCDLYEPMKAGLDFFYPLMSKGGLFLLHDYSSGFWDGAKKAIDEFCLLNDETVVLIPDKSGSVIIRKSK